MRKLVWTLMSSAVTLSMAACGSTDGQETESGAGGLSEDTVCTQRASYPNKPLALAVRAAGGEVDDGDVPVIHNFTAWPIYNPNARDGAYDANIVKAREDAFEARANIAGRFGDCAPKVQTHLEKNKPNIYIYFTGFGGGTQNNSLVDEAGIMRWINQRDPKALIFSMNWSCDDSHDAFCKENAVRLRSGDSSPEARFMTQSINAIAPAALETVKQLVAATDGNQVEYNTALSHSMQMAALLVDQLLVADADGAGLGKLHFLGYSMGAHAASQVLVQDFLGDGRGFKWTRKGQCDDGGDVCTIAHLKKVNWALSLGLSGWSEAALAYNETNKDGVSARSAADIEQYRNGGLFRVAAERFNGKANVFNRRMDPTGNSDDTIQRGFGDFLFGDYNHYSHDYSLPQFVDDTFVHALDAFLEAPRVTNSPEFGIVYDSAGKVDFDDCEDGSLCKASTGYLAHASNRSHERVTLVHTGSVPVTDGVKHSEKVKNLAATFTSAGTEPIVLNTFEQEDLRGGVELYFRPQFDTASNGVHGLFSYGSCGGSKEELMPQAFIQDGKVVFSMTYQGSEYAVNVPVDAASLTKGNWTHLAFTWDLPVVSLASTSSPTLAADVAKHGQALVLAAGLRKALPTTYNRQQGMGELRIFANGELVAKDALGTEESTRDCMSAAEVLSSRPYSVGGETYPPFVPYANYSAQKGDTVSLGAGPLGTTCKAFRVRNEQAFFGCAKAPSVNAGGDMDDITLVWGPGRAKYDEIDHRTGAPKLWPIGATYDATPYAKR